MSTSSSTTTLGRLSTPLMLTGFFLLALGVRWLWVSQYVSQLPFWDEWLDDPPLFSAYLMGQLEWSQFFAPFNGHRHVFQRLLKMGVFLLNDRQWDAQLQCTVNALLWAGVPALLLGLFGTATREAGRRVNAPVWAAAALLWLSPVLWYNATWGFQIAPALLILGTIGGAALVLRPGASFRERGWWYGAFLLVAMLFTQSSGLLGALAVGAALLAGVWQERRRPASADWVTLLICGGIAAAGIALQWGAGSGPAGFRAESVMDFLGAVTANFSWPLALEAPDGSVYAVGLLLWLPAPLLLGLWLAGRLGRAEAETELVAPRMRLLLALTLWVYGQLALIALFRGVDGRGASWRHYDFHAVGIFLNAWALSVLFQHINFAAARPRTLGLAAATAFAGLLIAGIAMQWGLSLQVLQARLAVNVAQENTVREYLASRDAEALNRKAIFETPFLYLDRPERLLSRMVIQEILPAAVREPLTTAVASTEAGGFGPGGVPPLAEEKLRHARTWSSWPPRSDRSDSAEVKGRWHLRPSRFAWMQMRYVFSPKSEGDQAQVLVANRRQKPVQASLRPSPKFDWNTVTLPMERWLNVFQDSKESWVVLTEPTELGRASYIAEKSRDCAWGVIIFGALLLAGGLAMPGNPQAPIIVS